MVSSGGDGVARGGGVAGWLQGAAALSAAEAAVVCLKLRFAGGRRGFASQ